LRGPIFVSAPIRADLDRVWELTQDPAAHARWDLRFSRIQPLDTLPDGTVRFRYERRLPGHTIRGTGTSIGELIRPDGTRTSALRFTTSDRLSPLRDGRGFWRYRPTAQGVLFETGYDYLPGWGTVLDRLVMRRLIVWMTAWSFDRLRIWAERGEEPETWPLRSVLWWGRRGRPRAARTVRGTRAGDPLRGAPSTLDRLEAP